MSQEVLGGDRRQVLVFRAVHEGCLWECDRPQSERFGSSRFWDKVKRLETFLVVVERLGRMAVLVGRERCREVWWGRSPDNAG